MKNKNNTTENLIEHHPNGKMSYDYYTASQGTYEKTYHENGGIAYSCHTNPNGFTCINTYDDMGKQLTSTFQQASGNNIFSGTTATNNTTQQAEFNASFGATFWAGTPPIPVENINTADAEFNKTNRFQIANEINERDTFTKVEISEDYSQDYTDGYNRALELMKWKIDNELKQGGNNEQQ